MVPNWSHHSLAEGSTINNPQELFSWPQKTTAQSCIGSIGPHSTERKHRVKLWGNFMPSWIFGQVESCHQPVFSSLLKICRINHQENFPFIIFQFHSHPIMFYFISFCSFPVHLILLRSMFPSHLFSPHLLEGGGGARMYPPNWEVSQRPENKAGASIPFTQSFIRGSLPTGHQVNDNQAAAQQFSTKSWSQSTDCIQWSHRV